MRFLICSAISSVSQRAVKLGAQLANAAHADATLLGVVDTASQQELETLLAQGRSQFTGHCETKIRTGRAIHEIMLEIADGGYDLLITGSRGRHGWVRKAFGSISARLAKRAPIPILIVPNEPPDHFRGRVLACTSGDARGEKAAQWGGQVAQWMGGELSILHVMSQMALAANAKLDDLRDDAQEAILQNTREGAHLKRMMELALPAGPVAVAPRPKLRHGLVLEEIAAEANGGDYDIVVIGAHQPPDLPERFGLLKAYLLEDVADQILAAVQRPVLVAR